MAILRLELDNILCFDNFKADFSYPKKLVNSTLENEYLQNYPFIRYKRVNVIVGSNASGKTSLGKAIWHTFRFLRKKEAHLIQQMVSKKTKEASILIDCVFAEGLFFRFEVIAKPNGEIDARYRPLILNKTDSYESVLLKLPDTPFQNYLQALENVVSGGWNFCFPTIEEGFDFISCKYPKNESEEFVSIFENVLKTLDPSIEKVFKSKEQEDTYIIKMSEKTIAVKHGEKISGLNYLSSGTKYAINIAALIFSIKKHTNGFYYADEQFSYVNSDIEIACLNKMVDLLGDGEQLFLTTHNTELLSLPYPNHCFSFLKKEIINNKSVISLVDASKFEKRNNVIIKNLYDNDAFDMAPNTEKVFEIANN